ncbi:MAG: sulfotransferase [Flavobacteriales bacterium]|nr:sulfotransferase [Flavobacteriales bacterium]
MKPGLFIIGSQKAGTTALFEMLALHPRIGASTPKELRFSVRIATMRRE